MPEVPIHNPVHDLWTVIPQGDLCSYGCGRPADQVVVTVNGWLHEACDRCAYSIVCWPPVPA